MPELIWKGKQEVMNHHLEVPVRSQDRQYSYPAEESENRIIHGDNLEALVHFHNLNFMVRVLP